MRHEALKFLGLPETRPTFEEMKAIYPDYFRAYIHKAVELELLDPKQIGRAHVRTPVTNAHLVCRLMLEKKQTNIHDSRGVFDQLDRQHPKTTRRTSCHYGYT